MGRGSTLISLQTDIVQNIPILTISGRFDKHTAPEVGQWLEENLSQYLIINLSQISFVDSSALATLIHGMKQHRNRAGDIYLAALQEPVQVIFNLTRLNKAFRIYPDVETAVSALKNKENER